MTKISITTVNVPIYLDEIQVEISGYYEPETEDRFYDRNGDPGTPGLAAQFDITKIMWNGVDITEAVRKQKGFKWDDMESECISKF